MANMKDFLASLAVPVTGNDLQFVDHWQRGIPIYDGHVLRQLSSSQYLALRQEWAWVWQYGAGVLLVKNLYQDPLVVEAMTEVIIELLDQQSKKGHAAGDHFAEQGKNGRLWNSLEKSALHAADVFIPYYANPLLAQLCTAWLGPKYQMTAQVNVVYPGGKAQQPHRDYHLGFLTQQELASVPLHVQIMSSMLTLQGGIAHTKMSIESGPTMLLPHSQRYPHGYGLYQEQIFKDYFFENQVQLLMNIGDGVFFNPALMHGAGANVTQDVDRCANLLQIASPYSVSMEALDHQSMQQACYQPLQKKLNDQNITADELDAIVTAISDNYPFPANMDRDPPGHSLMPLSGRDIYMQALQQQWTQQALTEALESLYCRKGNR